MLFELFILLPTLTLFILFVFILFNLFYTALTVACMSNYIVRECKTQVKWADELVRFCVGWVFKAKNFSIWCMYILRYFSFQRKKKESMTSILKTVPTINNLFGVISPILTWWDCYQAVQFVFLIWFKIKNINWNYTLTFVQPAWKGLTTPPHQSKQLVINH